MKLGRFFVRHDNIWQTLPIILIVIQYFLWYKPRAYDYADQLFVGTATLRYLNICQTYSVLSHGWSHILDLTEWKVNLPPLEAHAAAGAVLRRGSGLDRFALTTHKTITQFIFTLTYKGLITARAYITALTWRKPQLRLSWWTSLWQQY